MSQSHDTGRCWLCDHATWFLPAWTWMSVLVTGSAMLALLRPDAVVGWLLLMGVLLVLLGGAVAVLMDENSRDRIRAEAERNGGTETAAVTPPRRVRK